MSLSAQRRQISKDRFSSVFGGLKSQSYIDPPARGITNVHRTISWNATGTQIATGGSDKSIRIWNPDRPSSKSQIELKGHTHGLEKVLFNPVKEFELASCASDGTVRFWDVRARSCTTKLDGLGDVFTLSWSVDGSAIVCGTKSEVLTTISTTSTPTIISSHPQPSQTNQTCFTNAYPPAHILSTHGDGTVAIRHYPSLKVLHTLIAHTSACSSVSYSPSGKSIAIGGSDAMISLWDTTDWVCRRTLSNPTYGNIKSLSWSWDGRFLVGGSEDVHAGEGASSTGGLEIYHAETGEVMHTVPTGAAGVPAVEWHPNRYWLAHTQIEPSGKTVLKIIGVGTNSIV